MNSKQRTESVKKVPNKTSRSIVPVGTNETDGIVGVVGTVGAKVIDDNPNEDLCCEAINEALGNAALQSSFIVDGIQDKTIALIAAGLLPTEEIVPRTQLFLLSTLTLNTLSAGFWNQLIKFSANNPDCNCCSSAADAIANEIVATVRDLVGIALSPGIPLEVPPGSIFITVQQALESVLGSPLSAPTTEGTFVKNTNLILKNLRAHCGKCKECKDCKKCDCNHKH